MGDYGDEDVAWNGNERRNGHREHLRNAVVEGIEEYWNDKERVRKAVSVLLESFQEELSSGAGKALFRGFRRVFWLIVISLVVLGFGGWQAMVAFVKAVFGASAH